MGINPAHRGPTATRSGRQRGPIEERGPGQYRVSVYAGVDPLTHRRRYLRETASTQREARKARELMDATATLRGGRGIDAWFWGHEHRSVCFGAHEGIGYPTRTGRGAALEEPATDPTRRPLEYTDTFIDPDEFERRTPGFTVVDLDGRHATVTYLNPDGGR